MKPLHIVAETVERAFDEGADFVEVKFNVSGREIVRITLVKPESNKFYEGLPETLGLWAQHLVKGWRENLGMGLNIQVVKSIATGGMRIQ